MGGFLRMAEVFALSARTSRGNEWILFTTKWSRGSLMRKGLTGYKYHYKYESSILALASVALARPRWSSAGPSIQVDPCCLRLLPKSVALPRCGA